MYSISTLLSSTSSLYVPYAETLTFLSCFPVMWLAIKFSADCFAELDATAVMTCRMSVVPLVSGSISRSLAKTLAISPVAGKNYQQLSFIMNTKRILTHETPSHYGHVLRGHVWDRFVLIATETHELPLRIPLMYPQFHLPLLFPYPEAKLQSRRSNKRRWWKDCRKKSLAALEIRLSLGRTVVRHARQHSNSDHHISETFTCSLPIVGVVVPADRI